MPTAGIYTIIYGTRNSGTIKNVVYSQEWPTINGSIQYFNYHKYFVETQQTHIILLSYLRQRVFRHI